MKVLLQKPALVLAALVSTGMAAVIIFYNILPASLSQNESADYTNFYFPVAVNILEGQGITDQGDIAVRYPPGYPLLLAGTMKVGGWLGLSQTGAVYALVWLCFGLSVGLTYLISRIFWESWLSIVPAGLWMTYPFALWLAKQPNSEIPFTVFFLLGIYLFLLFLTNKERPNSLLLVSALVLGLAMMVRPIAIGLGAVIIFFWLFCDRVDRAWNRIWLAAAFLAVTFLPAMIWGAWVYQRSGELVFVSPIGTAALRDGLTFNNPDKSYRQLRNYPEDVNGVMLDFYQQREQMTSNRAVINLVVNEFKNKPVPTLKFLVLKALRSWYALDSMKYEQYTWPVQLIYMLLVSFGGYFAWRNRYIEKEYLILILLITVYFWGMTTLALSIMRYTMPVISLLFLLIPGLVKTLLTYYRTHLAHGKAPDIMKM